MKVMLPLAAFLLVLPLHVAAAQEPHGAVTAFEEFVAAVNAKDGREVSRFVSIRDWAALAKSGKQDELISPMIAAAQKEGATFSFTETEGSNFFLTGMVIIHPDEVRVPVLKGGDPWTLDVATLVGEVEVSEEEQDAFNSIGQLVSVLNAYKQSAGTFPTTEQGLQALIEKPTSDPIPSRWFRLRREIPKDPWGNEFNYKSDGGDITVRSLGPDGKESEDDLVNPF